MYPETLLLPSVAVATVTIPVQADNIGAQRSVKYTHLLRIKYFRCACAPAHHLCAPLYITVYKIKLDVLNLLQVKC